LYIYNNINYKQDLLQLLFFIRCLQRIKRRFRWK